MNIKDYSIYSGDIGDEVVLLSHALKLQSELEALKKDAEKLGKELFESNTLLEESQDAVSKLHDENEALKKENEWISVDDRLPKLPEGKCWIRVVLKCPYREPEVMLWNGKYFTTRDYHLLSYVGIKQPTHWMLLPEPPKEQKGE